MAYAEKYFISYCDDFNTPRRISVLQRDFVGSATELLADTNPCSITYESSEDFKFSPVRPSTASVYMVFGSGDGVDFEEFWTADEKEFKVEVIKDGTIEWSGYVIPNGFQYEFTGGLYHASIEASDGLSTLEALTFVDDNQKPYGNQDLVYNNEFEFPPSLIITEILKKLELDLDLWVCVDSYEQTMTKIGDVRDADPLSSCYLNVKTFIKEGENKRIPYWYGSGEEWNCLEVLENVLHIFGAKIYQEFGVWRVKSVNVDVDYGTGVTQRYWRKYNTAGTYLFDYEVVDDEINIPCNDNTKFMLGNDHVMGMDIVYKSFRMNYEYTFVRDGDSPIDLVPNGSFCDFNNNSILAAPTGWERWRRDNKWYIRIKDITIPFEDAGGNTCGIEIGTHKSGIPTSSGAIVTDPNPAIWTALRNITTRPTRPDRNRGDDSTVLKGYKIILDVWNKFKARSADATVDYAPMYRFILYGTENDYYLRNGQNGLVWERLDSLNSDLEEANFFYFTRSNIVEGVNSDLYTWKNYRAEIEEVPENGVVQFFIHGLAASTGRDSSNFPAFKAWNVNTRTGDYSLTDKWRVVRENWIDWGGDIPRLQIAGLKVGYIPVDNDLPQQQDFIYNNTNDNYTLENDPITVYNGDVQDQNHISNIIVPTNTSGGKNFWDDLSNTYGSSSLGLLTVREIMRQYQKPYRILEGSIKIQDPRFGSVYTFSTIPNVRFILQRGSFNTQKQYIEGASFIQITDDTLPDGGNEGGNDLEPEWVNTGSNYCQIGEDNLNTGYVITEQVDINPNSETYQETQEIVGVSQDLTSCPLNTPRLYYWGSDDVYLNPYTLLFAPFTQIDNLTIQLSYNNDEGNYLYFVHLKTLGSVERIYTNTTPGNVISDWIYLEDIIIDGYIYRVLRTDYVMTEFVNFTHNFKFA